MAGMGVIEILFSGFFLVAGVGTAVYVVSAIVSEIRDHLVRRRVLREYHRELSARRETPPPD